MEMSELEKRLRELEATVADLRQRVQATEDVNEIKQLQWTYLNALMATDWDTCAGCFAEDALVDVYLHDPVRGKGAIERWFKEELSQTHAGREGDVCIHPIPPGQRQPPIWKAAQRTIAGGHRMRGTRCIPAHVTRAKTSRGPRPPPASAWRSSVTSCSAVP